jgi:LysM repeat protein
MGDERAPETGQNESQNDRPEYLKFVVFLAVLLAIVVAVALVVPPIFNNIVPSVLGLDSTSAPESVPANGFDVAPESGLGGIPSETETSPQTHTVQEGETLPQIAVSYGITLEALAAANNIISPQQISAGTVLVIPQAE